MSTMAKRSEGRRLSSERIKFFFFSLFLTFCVLGADCYLGTSRSSCAFVLRTAASE
jgi:hypothetical protein